MLIMKMLGGGKPPFDLKTFKFMTTEKKDWKAQRKEARVVEREAVMSKATKPERLLDD
jgi:hypothetical protein